MTNTQQIPDILRIDIHHAHGTMSFSPNSLIMALLQSPGMLDGLEPTGEPGLICGEPSLIYQTAYARAPLNAGQIRRLTMRNLTAEEFHALYARLGDIFELHDDFYDPKTGEAFQPKA